MRIAAAIGLLVSRTMNLASIATVLPERSWTQRECWESARDTRSVRGLKPRSREILEKILLGLTTVDEVYAVVGQDRL